jgi:hypothetical protein
MSADCRREHEQERMAGHGGDLYHLGHEQTQTRQTLPAGHEWAWYPYDCGVCGSHNAGAVLVREGNGPVPERAWLRCTKCGAGSVLETEGSIPVGRPRRVGVWHAVPHTYRQSAGKDSEARDRRSIPLLGPDCGARCHTHRSSALKGPLERETAGQYPPGARQAPGTRASDYLRHPEYPSGPFLSGSSKECRVAPSAYEAQSDLCG